MYKFAIMAILTSMIGCSTKSSVIDQAPLQSEEMILKAGECRITFCRISPSKYGLNYPDYWMSKTEVTNKQYKEYLKATKQIKDDSDVLKEVKRRERERDSSTADIIYTVDDEAIIWKDSEYPKGLDELPVTLITLVDAQQYAEWVTKQNGHGLIRLPTWNEWMIAAYGKDRSYPWGNDWKPELVAGSYGKDFDGRLSRPKAVGSYPPNASPEGVVDLIGNVSEYIIQGDVTGKGYFNLGARWMGGAYDAGFVWGFVKGKELPKLQPRNDYWGYSHHATMRASSVGIRLIIDPNNDTSLLSRDRIFEQNNKAWNSK